ncbi:MAG: 3-hydroxyisobutyrate dehydrogenase [Subtercola sp.]|nr:3-hydroxyisobutyrate dehydrogenase [Subtercola sp.]
MSEPIAAPIDVAIVGLGNMGTPMATRWLEAGYRVHGFDLSEAARERFEAAGGIVHDTADEAIAASAVAILMLPNSAIVNQVLTDAIDSGALSSGTVIIDMSSSEPTESQKNAARLAELDVRFIDAPVSGGVRGAQAGTLTIMVGGDEQQVENQRDLLERLGTVVRVGPVGAGHAVKALNNLLSATHLWMTSEAVLIGERFGVDAETILKAFNGSSGRSGSSEVKWPKFILPGTYDSGFAGRLMLKDAKIATGLAREVGVPTSLGEEVVAVWQKAVDELPAGADHTEIARWLRERE